MQRLLDGLNESQKEAVLAELGPVLILAGPGSGKTKTLTHRIAYAIARGTPPAQILAVTFTNKAAGEMRERVAGLLGDSVVRGTGPFIGTFHAFALSILREYAGRLGYLRHFTVYDEDDSRTLLKEVLHELSVNTRQFPLPMVGRTISSLKNELIAPARYGAEAGSGPFPEMIVRVWTRYQERLRESHAMDFDDLLVHAVSLLAEHPAVAAAIRARFCRINVDEYQDTNHAQYELINLLAREHRNIAVVGDDAQAIYSFRGADFRNILNFEKDWPDAKIIVLGENYRSTQVILDAAEGLIQHNVLKKEKRLVTRRGTGSLIAIAGLYDEREEAAFIAERIRSLADEGYRPRDIAILYRTNAQSRALEESFIRRRIPYTLVGGVRFYQRKEIKDIVSYLRVLVNPNDMVAIKRVINLPPRGIGKKALLEYLAGKRDDEAVRQFDELVAELRGLGAELPAGLFVERLIERIGYPQHLEETEENAAERMENVRELAAVARQYDEFAPPEGIVRLLENAALMAESDEAAEERREEPVTLMTLHAAKGLEFPIVFIAGLEEGVLPHARAMDALTDLEEERRILYVGLTRAKDRVLLTFALRRAAFGGIAANPPSRFLSEIPEHLVERLGDTEEFEEGIIEIE